MTREVAEAVRYLRVVAVSNQGIDNDIDGVTVPALAAWADVLYSADRKWWENNAARALAFAGLKITIQPPGGAAFKHPDVKVIGNGGMRGVDSRPTHLRTGGNSGYQAVHLAMHFGARRILLCGFDMHSPAGREHWFGQHAWRQKFRSPYPMFISRFVDAAPLFRAAGVEIINCTPGSALKCFPSMSLTEALSG
jgi:hypothetical protein